MAVTDSAPKSVRELRFMPGTSTVATLPQLQPGTRWSRLAPGIAVSLALAVVAMRIGSSPWLQQHGLSALTIAIALAMLVGNSVYVYLAPRAAPGVAFSKQVLLRTGIVLYGLRLTLQDIGHVGVAGVLTDTLVLGSTFALAWWLGTRWLGLERRAAILIGAGSSVCGAAAVMATEPVVRARPEELTVAVATVVVFGTIAVFLYPALFALNLHWHVIDGGSRGFGIYTGSTIHEVAQVVAAARSSAPEAADSAVITKMVRVMMLAPLLVGLSAYLSRGDRAEASQAGPTCRRISVPWFAVAFLGVVIVNSLVALPPTLLTLNNQLDTVLLATAMAALGLTTHVSAIRQAGTRPLILALVLFAWLVVGGAGINHAVAAMFR
jgi:uncharacterized integral membrane protein (TIGR00698 family)